MTKTIQWHKCQYCGDPSGEHSRWCDECWHTDWEAIDDHPNRDDHKTAFRELLLKHRRNKAEFEKLGDRIHLLVLMYAKGLIPLGECVALIETQPQ